MFKRPAPSPKSNEIKPAGGHLGQFLVFCSSASDSFMIRAAKSGGKNWRKEYAKMKKCAIRLKRNTKRGRRDTIRRLR